MKSSNVLRIILVTVPDIKVARKLSRAALAARLVACANIVPGLESHYWWRGKIESAKELLVLFKTTRNRLNALEKLVLKTHPYDTPEFVVMKPSAATPRYLRWWIESA